MYTLENAVPELISFINVPTEQAHVTEADLS